MVRSRFSSQVAALQRAMRSLAEQRVAALPNDMLLDEARAAEGIAALVPLAARDMDASYVALRNEVAKRFGGRTIAEAWNACMVGEL